MDNYYKIERNILYAMLAYIFTLKLGINVSVECDLSIEPTMDINRDYDAFYHELIMAVYSDKLFLLSLGKELYMKRFILTVEDLRVMNTALNLGDAYDVYFQNDEYIDDKEAEQIMVDVCDYFFEDEETRFQIEEIWDKYGNTTLDINKASLIAFDYFKRNGLYQHLEKLENSLSDLPYAFRQTVDYKIENEIMKQILYKKPL